MALGKGQKILVYLMGVVLGMLILSLFPKKEERGPHPWHQQTAPEGYFPLTATDDYGREVRLEEQPRWLISLAPSITEMLFAMDMGDHLLAVTEWDRYPEQARMLAESGGSVGRIDHPNLEAIAARSPELVLASNLTPAAVLERIDQGPRTRAFALHHDNFQDVLTDVATLGRILGVPGRALTLVRSLEDARDGVLAQLSAVAGERPRRAVILLHLEDGLLPGWAPGSGTWLGDLIEMAQGENVAAQLGSSYGQISLEALLASDPEVIFVKLPEGEGAVERFQRRLDELAGHPVWSQISAVRDERLVTVENGPFSIPGPRMVEALEAVAQGLWPEAFGGEEGAR